MQGVSIVIARPIKVQKNTQKSNPAQWMQIKDAVTGQILHTGTPAYIAKVAQKRYGQKIV